MYSNWSSWLKRIFRGGPGRGKSKPRPRTQLRVEILEDRSLPSVTLLGGITGLNNTGWEPPDTGVAVGPSYAVETVNSNLAIYNKSTGSLVSEESLASLFSGFYSGNSGQFDPQVLYDDISDRFMIAAPTSSSTGSGSGVYTATIDFAVSNSSDPTQGWTTQQIEVDQGGTNWVDNGKLGYNADAWVYSGNRYGNAGGAMVLSIDKSSIGNGTWTSYLNDISGFSTVPARMDGSAPGGPMWFVESNAGGGNSVSLLEMTNVLSTNPTFTTTDLPTADYSQSSMTQPGGTLGFDSRTESVEWYNNNLAAAWNSMVGSDAAAFWTEFNTGGTSPTLTQEGVIHPGSGISTYMPAVAVDAAGDLGLTYIQSSSTQYPSTYVTGRLASDPLGTMEGSVLVQTGDASLGGGRVGDYAGMGLDPSSTNTFWAANEYGLSGVANNWGTAIAEFQFQAGVPAPPANLVATPGNTQVSLSWTASSGAASYDIYRGTSSGGEALLATGVTATDFTDTGLSNGTTYFYEVTAVNAAGQSADSNQSSATPGTPVGLNLLQSFAGLNYTVNNSSITPPDTTLAAGPGSIISAVNDALLIQSKTGAVVTATAFSTFFAPVSNTSDSFTDPYVLYDDISQRFYIGILGSSNGFQTDYFDFAVSTSADPTSLTGADWTNFTRITSVSEGGNDFADFPKMGWNADAVFVSFNQFPIAGGPVHDLILSISKQAILSGTPLEQNVNYFQVDAQTDHGLGNGDHRIVIPARMHGSQPGNLEYFVQQDQDLTYTSKSTVHVIAMSDYLSTNPTFTVTTIAVDPYWNSPGVTQLTNQTDDRMLSADWDNNLLVAAQNIGTASGQNLARWYEFSTAGAAPTLMQQGNIDLGAGIDTSYPAMAINSAGDIALTFIGSGPDSSRDPSVYVTGRSPSDAPDTMQAPILVGAGVPGAASGSRGGDYAAAEYDPTDGSFWVANEYTIDSRSTDDWGVAIGHVQFGLSANEIFVANVYQKLLHRAPDPGAIWVNLLDSGTSPSTLVLDIEQSPEYLTDLVASLYQQYLHRAPDPGAQFWVTVLQDGQTIETVRADILGSAEYYADHGETNQGYVAALYEDVLGRAADPSGESAWLQALADGMSRQAVALNFLTSTEYRDNLVESYYLAYLRRSADAAGLAGWVGAMQAGATDQQVLADIFGSAEGYALWS